MPRTALNKLNLKTKQSCGAQGMNDDSFPKLMPPRFPIKLNFPISFLLLVHCLLNVLNLILPSCSFLHFPNFADKTNKAGAHSVDKSAWKIFSFIYPVCVCLFCNIAKHIIGLITTARLHESTRLAYIPGFCPNTRNFQ